MTVQSLQHELTAVPRSVPFFFQHCLKALPFPDAHDLGLSAQFLVLLPPLPCLQGTWSGLGHHPYVRPEGILSPRTCLWKTLFPFHFHSAPHPKL